MTTAIETAALRLVADEVPQVVLLAERALAGFVPGVRPALPEAP